MENYETMYYKLFNRVTDIIEELKAAQVEAEDIFIYAKEVAAEQSKTGMG